MIGLWRLQVLREVMRHGTMRGAAQALSVSPSAVSQQLALLEREVGLELLERVGRRVKLTEAGQDLARHADMISDAMLAAETDMARRRATVTGTLRFAAFPTAARAIMPSVMAAIAHRHPDLRVSLRDLEAPESLAALTQGEVDIAIVDEYADAPSTLSQGLQRHLVLEDPIYVARPTNQVGPWSGSLHELRDQPWIMDTEQSAFYQAVIDACRKAGFEPHVRSNCKDFAVITALVEAGLGVAALPGLSLIGRRVKLDLRPMKPSTVRRIVAVVRPQRSALPAVSTALVELDGFATRYRPPRTDSLDPFSRTAAATAGGRD